MGQSCCCTGSLGSVKRCALAAVVAQQEREVLLFSWSRSIECAKWFISRGIDVVRVEYGGNANVTAMRWR